jgi:predicted Zn-dependent protease
MTKGSLLFIFKLRLNLSWFPLGILVLSSLLSKDLQANNSNNLPQLGTIAQHTLSIAQERQIGDIYMRATRSQQPIIFDPILNQYIDELGGRLVLHAQDVNAPFTFFTINNETINAFAFFGGHVGLHSGLLLTADTESELASVIAHEIAHITQRHLARSIEAMQQKQPLTMASILGGILLTIISPEAGLATLAATGAIAQQSAVTNIREHEIEADSIGMVMMARASFNPNGVTTLFSKLAEKSSSNQVPQILMTHPLPQSRLEKAFQRAQQYKGQKYYESENFMFAKRRIEIRYSKKNHNAILRDINAGLKKTPNLAHLQYAKALIHFQQENYQKAQAILTPLLKKTPENMFFLDLQADIYNATKQYKQGIRLLLSHYKLQPSNQVLAYNLAFLYQENNQTKEAIQVLETLSYQHKNTPELYKMLMNAYLKEKNRALYYQANAHFLSLYARYDEALIELNKAKPLLKKNQINSAILQEKIKQIQVLKQQYEQIL